MKRPLDPCKSLCIQNKLGCEPIMKRFGFSWPDSMACDKFPENELCIREKNGNPPNSGQTPDLDVEPNQDNLQISQDRLYQCPPSLEVNPSYNFSIRIGSSIINNCGIPCDDYFFSDSDSKFFARIWIGIWSILCLVASFLTASTFLIDSRRFQYPERPVVFLSICYFMISLVYLIGTVLKNKAVCVRPLQYTTSTAAATVPAPLLIAQGTKFETCIILFMILYFFSIAASIWFVVLTITWYLAAKRHWAHEAIAQNSQYFHFVAWAIPAGNSIALLAWGKIDGDPISGVCFTGISDPWAMRIFVILPLCICLLLATGFLLAGYVSMFRIRSIVKTEGAKTDKLEKLIMRAGMFSVIYIVPAVIVIGCYIYETARYDSWMVTWYRTRICSKYRKDVQRTCRRIGEEMERSRQASFPVEQELIPTTDLANKDYHLNQEVGKQALLSLTHEPEFELFMIKYLMSLIVGIGSIIWIWSGKTLVAWKRFFTMVLCCRWSQARRNQRAMAKNSGAALQHNASGAHSTVHFGANQQPPQLPGGELCYPVLGGGLHANGSGMQPVIANAMNTAPGAQWPLLQADSGSNNNANPHHPHHQSMM